MKFKFLLAAITLSLVAFQAARADVRLPDRKPTPKPSPTRENKEIFHAYLTIAPDKEAAEARLVIPQETLDYLLKAANGNAANASFTSSLAQSSSRTVVAGFFFRSRFRSAACGSRVRVRSARIKRLPPRCSSLSFSAQASPSPCAPTPDLPDFIAGAICRRT